MDSKPIYEEMEQRVKELENEILERKRAEAEARAWKNRFEAAILRVGICFMTRI